MSRILILTSLLITGLFFQTFAGNESLGEKKRLAQLAYDNLNVDSELSLKYARKLELLAEHEQDTVYWCYALNLQGLLYNRFLSYSAALNALELANSLNPENFNVLFDLGNTHRLAGNEELAVFYYQKALDAEQASANSKKMVYGDLGLLQLDLDKTEKAKEYFVNKLSLAKSTHDSLSSFVDLSYLYLKQNDLKNTEYYLKTASQLEKRLTHINSNSRFILAGLYSNYGQYHLEQGNTAEAEKFFTQALEIADQLRIGLVQEECYRGLQRVSVQKNDEAMFLTYWKKQKEFSVENSRQLSAYYEYNIYKKDRELQALKDKQKLSFGANYQLFIFGSLIVALALLISATLGYFLWRSNTKNKNLEIALSKREQEINALQIERARLQARLMAATNDKNL